MPTWSVRAPCDTPTRQRRHVSRIERAPLPPAARAISATRSYGSSAAWRLGAAPRKRAIVAPGLRRLKPAPR